MKTLCHRNYRVPLMGCSPVCSFLQTVPDLRNVEDRGQLAIEQAVPCYCLLVSRLENLVVNLVVALDAQTLHGARWQFDHALDGLLHADDLR